MGLEQFLRLDFRRLTRKIVLCTLVISLTILLNTLGEALEKKKKVCCIGKNKAIEEDSVKITVY